MISIDNLIETSKKNRKKTSTKQKQKTKKDSEAESDDASSEEDGYFDSKEVDYMSDTSSSGLKSVHF